MPLGRLPELIPAEYSATVPAGVIRPTRLLPFSVNQTLPSGPAAMPEGEAPPVFSGNSVMVTASARLAKTSAANMASASAGLIRDGVTTSTNVVRNARTCQPPGRMMRGLSRAQLGITLISSRTPFGSVKKSWRMPSPGTVFLTASIPCRSSLSTIAS